MQPLSYIEISATALQHNVRLFKTFISDQTKVIAVVKANAYGHGLKEVVTSVENDVDLFQVDDIEELSRLREFTKKEVIILGYINPANTDLLLEFDAIPAVLDIEHLLAFNQAALALGKTLTVHLAVDADFGREGITLDYAQKFADAALSCKNITINGIYAHFSSTDSDPHLVVTNKQLAVFKQVISIIKNTLVIEPMTHLAATGGIIICEAARELSAIRLGKGLYGRWPSKDFRLQYEANGFFLQSPLTWKSTVVQVKQVPAGYPVGYSRTYITPSAATLALIPQGYSDGIDRGLSNRGSVLISGTRCPIRGRVSMNMIVADISHLEKVMVGDEVVLIGSQGAETITPGEIAALNETIDYEVLVRISPLLPRVLVK